MSKRKEGDEKLRSTEDELAGGGMRSELRGGMVAGEEVRVNGFETTVSWRGIHERRKREKVEIVELTKEDR